MPICSNCGEFVRPGSSNCAKCNQPLPANADGRGASGQWLPSGMGKSIGHKPATRTENSNNDGTSVMRSLGQAAGFSGGAGAPSLSSVTTNYGNQPPQETTQSCQSCGNVLQGGVVQFQGALYHPQCLKCFGCGAVLDHNKLFVLDNKPSCESCKQLNSPLPSGPLCGGCQQPVSGPSITAMQKKWHKDCFRCTACNKSFTSPGLINKGGKPYHKECA